MSAFIVSETHIKTLAVYAAGTRYPMEMRVDPRYLAYDIPELKTTFEFLAEKDRVAVASYYANMMYIENIISVNSRYNETAEPEKIAVTENDFSKKQYTAVEILKLCNCLIYQSCEHEEWKTSGAKILIQKIKESAINDLPGYDEAPWEI